MAYLPLPASAAWLHQEARTGYEVAFFASAGDGLVLHGSTSAVQDGRAWVVEYEIHVDARWTTRSALVTGRSKAGLRTVRLEHDGHGQWQVDARPAPHLDGCFDVDLESSALTNALPVHRLALERGDSAEAPGAFVRVDDLAVERLEQVYLRTSADTYRYGAPAFDFVSDLSYDADGLVVRYPGIAVRTF